jgi:hypothetical protein
LNHSTVVVVVNVGTTLRSMCALKEKLLQKTDTTMMKALAAVGLSHFRDSLGIFNTN